MEAEKSTTALPPAPAHFRGETGAKRARQVVVDGPFVAADPSLRRGPRVAPAATLLSMLP